MGKIYLNCLSDFLVLIFFIYEYMYKGYKLLVRGEKRTIFPYNFKEALSKRFPKIQYSYNYKLQRVMAYGGIFLSGMIFAYFIFMFFLIF